MMATRATGDTSSQRSAGSGSAGQRLPARAARETAESIRVHDLKNLSCRLTALVQNLSEHYEDPFFKDSAMEVLQDTVEKMNLMVSRYRRQRGKAVVKMKVDLSSLLAEIVSEIPQSTFPNVTINEEYDDTPAIWGEVYYLRTALLSFIVNALEAMPRGGTLSVRTRSISRGEQVAVEIEDTGVGMTRSFVRKKLFAPFTTTKPDGLGLGLYNAGQVIDLHSGGMEVQSAPSRGTLFRIRFASAEVAGT